MNAGNKWVATVASIWIQCTSGSSYAFGIYSPILKSSQNYDQSTLDSIAVFKDIGANAGLLSGLLYSAVAIPSSPSHSSSSSSSSSSASCYWIRGPWVVHATGAIQCFMGYFFIWLSVTGIIPRPPVPLMCFFMFLAAHAQTFFNTADVVTAVQNFPDYSGTIVGIMKGFLGLSGAILIQVYDTIYEGNPSSFLLMLALLPTVVPFILMCLVRIYHTNTGDDKKLLNGFSVIALITAAYLMVIIILENVISLKLWARILAFVVLLLSLSSPLSVAIGAQLRDSQRLLQTSSLERTRFMDEPNPLEAKKTYVAHDPVGYQEVPSDVDHELITNDKRITLREEELNLLQAMRTGNFWMLFITMSCGMGSGLATVNNISQIGGSLGYSSVEMSTLVSLWSIWNFVGRFGAGYISDYFLHLRGWARPLFMVITLASMSIGHAVIATGLPGALYAGSVLVGVCYGSQWSLMPTITSEIFGVRHMGTIFNTISIASPVGSYILSVRVVGYIYDKEASDGGSTCSGAHCFMLSFLIMASVTLLGSVVAFVLFLRTRRFYKLVICRRIQHFASHEEGI
ncbi:protein NUCLEAR FUSION DEFECTIVE 4-like [Macadamia integrifolia]|uniref:protein NUCLEAR FUSION DEFECTIVE 4-like n=1 Tax=Macadamia integrifolia TaxID=60698 RepID=UPI001C4EE0F7|nr:protein NUCLEAR FUSION DEFECTIVE 4-like [Macadamia integrifolia]